MKNALLFLLLVVSTSIFAQNKDVTKFKISGLVEKPMILDIDSLKTRNMIVGKVFKLASLKGQIIKAISNYRGVSLKSLLDEAKIIMPNSKERGLYYVLITTNDGQKTIFSWNELYCGTAGDKTVVIFEAEGRPISKDGSFTLICASDIFTESRYLQSIKSIEVAKI